MTTRAAQFELLLGGLVDSSGDPLTSGTVYFYSAGTSNAKNVWTEKEKTNAYTSITLDTVGQKQIYGQGVYKIIIKDSDGTTVYTWDNMKLMASNYYVRSVSANSTATIDDDAILVDTSGGDKTITLAPAANMTHPLIVKNIGANDVTIDPNASETIDGDSTYTLAGENISVWIFSDGTNVYSGNAYVDTTRFYAADAESTDTYVVTLSPAPAALTTGMMVNFKANTKNTGACTLNVNALGAKSIKTNKGSDPLNDDIEAGQILTVVYDGTNWQMQSQKGRVPVAFSAKLNATQSNLSATIANTIAFASELYDIGGNYNAATYTFTAPHDGYYQFSVLIWLLSVDSAAGQISINLITSNRTYYQSFDADDLMAADGGHSISLSVLADMDATDTAHVTIDQSGGANQMDVHASSYFTGYLAV